MRYLIVALCLGITACTVPAVPPGASSGIAPIPSPTQAPAGKRILGLTSLGGRTTTTLGDFNVVAQGEAPAYFREPTIQASLVQVDPVGKTIRIGHFYDPTAMEPAAAKPVIQGINAPVAFDEPGIYKVFGLQTDGRYREIGQITVAIYGTPVQASFEGMRPGKVATVNVPTTVTLWRKGAFNGCSTSLVKKVTVDPHAKTIDLGMTVYDQPPEVPTCMPSPSSPTSETEYDFTVTLSEAGIYTVRARTSDGTATIGNVTAQ